MHERARVLVLSWHSPSDDAIGAQRVRSFLHHLPAHGWEIDLITREQSIHFDGVEVHPVPDPIATFRERVIGRKPRGWRRLFSSIMFRLGIPDEQLVWSVRAVAHARALTPDAILVSGPPFSQWIAARRIARLCGAPLICDYRDLWTQSPYFSKGRSCRRVELALERAVWKQLAVSITVSEPLAHQLAEASHRPSRVVMNGFEPSEKAPQDSDVDGPLTLVHCGQLYQGKRDPTPLFRALKQAEFGPRDVSLRFFGPQGELVRRAAEVCGVEAMVEVNSTISHQEALATQRTADALILLLWNHPSEEGVYSGKVFEYLDARRRILMLGYPGGVAARLLKERDVGVVANDPSEIAAVLQGWLELKRSGRLTTLPSDVLRGLTRADQAAVLAEVLNDIRRRRRRDGD